MKPTNIRKKHLNKDVFSETNFSNHYIINPSMTEQYVVPPARVWQKIEKALDEQDRKKDNDLFSFASTQQVVRTKSRFGIYFAALGASLIASFWLWR
jgi:hypothetical protein